MTNREWFVSFDDQHLSELLTVGEVIALPKSLEILIAFRQYAKENEILNYLVTKSADCYIITPLSGKDIKRCQ
jgi:hypothetical protein